MEVIIRVLGYVGVGVILLFLNITFVRTVVNALRPSDFVIVPIKLIGMEDKDGAAGVAFAQLLHAKLRVIHADLSDAQDVLAHPPKLPEVAKLPEVGQDGLIPIVPLIQSEKLQAPTTLLPLPAVRLSVAGVEVGGLIPWIQGWLIQKHTLTFSIQFVDSDRAVIAGSVDALTGGQRGAIWLETRGSRDTIISQLAYAVLHKQLAEARGSHVGSLERAEFEQLLV